MKALVVGGAGYIGFEVSVLLKSLGYSTYILDTKRDIIPTAVRAGIKCLVDDVLSAMSVRQHYDVIINLVGGLDDAKLYGITEQGLKQACAPLLLRQMSEEARIVHVSTQYIYDGAELNKERVKPSPVTDYGRVHLMAEQGLANDNNAVILRCGTVWGEAKYRRWDTWGNHLLKAKELKEPVEIYHPRAMTCLLSMPNMVRSVEWALGADPGVYNVADLVNFRIDVAKILLGEYPITVRKSDTHDLSTGMDTSRIIKYGFEFLENIYDQS